MTALIGPTFGQELRAAGLLGLPFSWTAGGAFTFSPAMTANQVSAVQTVYAAHDPAKPSAPASVTRAQAKIQLARAGLLPAVKAAVAQAGGEIELWFDEALTWNRDDARIAILAGVLGLNSAQVDALFIAASAIT